MDVRIGHVALWTSDLERARNFFGTYFGAVAGGKYTNVEKSFESYFLTFPSDEARLEIMWRPGLTRSAGESRRVGLSHVAFALGSEHAVDCLTARLRRDGYTVVDGPRRTGDGYYESVVLDPDGNRIELTA